MQTAPDPRIGQVLAAIDQRLDQRWSVADLAALVQLSPSRFAHLFRDALGVSPGRYLQRVRVERASQLLARTSLPIAEVMRLVGCPDPSHFTRSFRSHFGMGPGEYRRRCALV